MSLQESEKKFNDLQLNLLRIGLILIPIFDFFFILSGFFYANMYLLVILNTIANIYLFFVIILLVGTYPGFRSTIILVLVSVLEILYILFVYFFVSVPSIDTASDLNSISFSAMRVFTNGIIGSLIIGLLGSILYLIFAIYFTKWFNEIFSRKNDFIRLFLISTIIEFGSFVILSTWELQIKTIFSEVLSSGIITNSMVSNYNNLIQILYAYGILHFLYLALELMAFVKLHNRVRAIQNGTYGLKHVGFIENQNYSNNQLMNSIQSNTIGPPDNVIANSNKKFCNKCGKELIEEAVFCPYCGTRFLKEE